MDIIYTTSNQIAANVIKLFTGCKWHHCGVIVDDYVIEARMFGGVIHTPIKAFKSRGEWAIESVKVTDEEKAKEFLLNQIGKGYDISGAISLPFRRDWQDKHKWYCSELVAAAFAAGGSPLVKNNLISVSPRDLWVQDKTRFN